ncbi:dopamine receptor [Biomphalaria glabrata]|uniref:D(5)-like dopamine receptor n=1 Tax=Biomphalaria glabrata TaxID=6526 RepID=A0A9W2YKK1_BIOGL|nr:D(5)-like dopamine receptor [Biomphalaria glabrata]XP_055863317.1 D(5)-like dopamine receptor [Biomphalaria glabrata]XP_055863318.1 D(5)-like dopamine receptor [Biomphalaria glabrata]KAI8731993.1 dopamine receptor D(1B) dopamine receptor-like Neuro-related/Reproduction [Biomphalaria glabrata]
MNNTTAYGQYSTANNSLTSLYFILTCLFLTALVVTLVTNIITVIVMVTTAELRTRTNAFIVSLSISDILYAGFMISLTVVTIIRYFVQLSVDNVAFQMATTFAWGIQIHGSNGNLLLVSVERWLYITQPFLYQRYVTTRTVVLSIAATWTVSLAVNIPYLSFGRNDLFSTKSYFIISLAYVNPAIHTACCIVLVAIYTHICVITLHHLKKLSKVKHLSVQAPKKGTRGSVPKISSVHAENWKSIKLLISICGIFFIFVSPYAYFVAYTSVNTSLGSSVSTWLMVCLLLLTFFHLSNFFVYSLGIRLFKKVIKKHLYRLRCWRGSRVGHVGSTSTGSALDMETRIQNISYISS